MALTEQSYIVLCRKQIEEKFAFGNGNGYTQRDLELLTLHIEEKTGVVLSLSTLKRLWKGDFKQSPQLATLNALAAVLDYRDWQDFKLRNRPAKDLSGSGTGTGPGEESIRPGDGPVPAPGGAENAFRPGSSRRRSTRRRSIGFFLALILVLTAVTIIILAVRRSDHGPKIRGPVHFSAQKTVVSGTPATVIFNYDLSQVEADSFFIQQSWNRAHRVPIDPEGDTYASIYYEAGYHRARLIADGSRIAMQPVHILSDGWEPHLYYSYQDREPVSFKNTRLIENGQLHLPAELLREKNVDLSRPFLTRISNSRVFNASSNNFSLVSRIKVDSPGAGACPFMQVTVVTEKHIFWVNLQQKGCERHASYKMGEISRFGENNDLSHLGVDVRSWQEIGIKVADKKAEISLNGQPLFRESFREDFGDIMGLIYIFSGTGSLDHVRMADAGGETVFEDAFGTVQ